MIEQETATIVFKSISGLATTYLSTQHVRNSTRETVNLRNSETDLLAQRMKASNGQKAFSFRGSKVWNELEHEVKQGWACDTEDDGPTLVRKPVVHEKAFTIFVPKTSRFDDKFTLLSFFTLIENLITDDVCPEKTCSFGPSPFLKSRCYL